VKWPTGGTPLRRERRGTADTIPNIEERKSKGGNSERGTRRKGEKEPVPPRDQKNDGATEAAKAGTPAGDASAHARYSGGYILGFLLLKIFGRALKRHLL